MMRFGNCSAALVACLALLSASSAWAVAIPGLYSTGVDDNPSPDQALPLGNDQPDDHYQLTVVPAGTSLAVRTFRQTLSAVTIPPGTPSQWSGDSTTSAWIGPSNADLALQPSGSYVYSTTFTIGPDLDPTTGRIDVFLFGDDAVGDIKLNGWDTGFTNYDPAHPDAAWSVPYHFILDHDILPGDNTLEFDVPNFSGPTGLRVQVISSIEQFDFGGGPGGPGVDIPEPGSADVLIVGLLGLGLALRRPLAFRSFSSPTA